MTVSRWLADAIEELKDAGISTARLDCLVLLEDVTGQNRAYLLAHPELELSPEQLNVLNAHIARRSQHIPLAYIRGRTEFYGRDFIVNDYVLEPRPESETMIELLKNTVQGQDRYGITIVDVGTGSGALAVTAALELPGSQAIAIDIDPNCLAVARQNAAALKANVEFLEGDLLAPLAKNPPDTIVLLCNLPYVPDSFHINQAATHEPRLAIFGGADGLDPYRRLFAQTDGFAKKPAYILTESLPPQHEQLTSIAAQHGYSQTIENDFIQVFTPAGT